MVFYASVTREKKENLEGKDTHPHNNPILQVRKMRHREVALVA